MNGKGSTRRPQQVYDEVLAENLERAFGKKVSIDMPMFSRGSGCKTSTIACEIARAIQDSIDLDESLPDDCVAFGIPPLQPGLAELAQLNAIFESLAERILQGCISVSIKDQHDDPT